MLLINDLIKYTFSRKISTTNITTYIYMNLQGYKKNVEWNTRIYI